MLVSAVQQGHFSILCQDLTWQPLSLPGPKLFLSQSLTLGATTTASARRRGMILPTLQFFLCDQFLIPNPLLMFLMGGCSCLRFRGASKGKWVVFGLPASPTRIHWIVGSLFFWLYLEVCGILVPQPGTEPGPPAVEMQSLGPPMHSISVCSVYQTLCDPRNFSLPASPVHGIFQGRIAQMVKHLPAMQETWVRSLSWEDPLEKEMATHSSTLAWKIPWMEESGRLQYMGSQRVGHYWATSLHILEWVAVSSSRGCCWCLLHLLHWQVESSPNVPPGTTREVPKWLILFVCLVDSSKLESLGATSLKGKTNGVYDWTKQTWKFPSSRETNNHTYHCNKCEEQETWRAYHGDLNECEGAEEVALNWALETEKQLQEEKGGGDLCKHREQHMLWR